MITYQETSPVSALDSFMPSLRICVKAVAGDFPYSDFDQVLHYTVSVVKNHLEDFIALKAQGGKPTVVFSRIATIYCEAERATMLWGTSQYVYRASKVAKVLGSALRGDHRHNYGGDPHRLDDFSYGDEIDAAADILVAFEKLRLVEKQVLFRRYGLGETLPNGSYDRKLSTSALKKLTAIVNGDL